MTKEDDRFISVNEGDREPIFVTGKRTGGVIAFRVFAASFFGCICWIWFYRVTEIDEYQTGFVRFIRWKQRESIKFALSGCGIVVNKLDKKIEVTSPHDIVKLESMDKNHGHITYVVNRKQCRRVFSFSLSDDIASAEEEARDYALASVICRTLDANVLTAYHEQLLSLWPFSHTFTTEALVLVHTFSLQVGVCYGVFKKGIEVVLRTKCGSNYTSTTPMEWTAVACDSSKWVICSIFHHVIRLVHGAVVFWSPYCIEWSRLLWEILKDADEFIDARSKRLTVLVAVTLFHDQLYLVRPTCLCCFLQDSTSLMDCDFSLDDVMNVPTYDHTSCYLNTREDLFQRESLFSCALGNHNLVFSNIFNDAHVFSWELTIHNGDIQLVQVKKSICVAYHVRRFLFHRGNRMLFVIMERMFSFERRSWSSLTVGYVYPTIHSLPFASFLHELHLGVLKTEFDVVRLMNLEFVAASSEQVDVMVVYV
ncbi:hypothetical protein Bca101_096781 [Brassica carinata]